MRTFESLPDLNWSDVILNLIRSGADVEQIKTGSRKILWRLKRTLPDGTVRHATYRSAVDAHITAVNVRSICNRLGLSVRDIERHFGWTLTDYTDDAG